MQRSAADNYFRCMECAEIFESEAAIEKHITKMHAGPMNFRCIQCNHPFKDNWHLKRHQLKCGQKQSPQMFQCPACRTSYKDLWRLKRHQEAKHNGPPTLEISAFNVDALEEQENFTHTSQPEYSDTEQFACKLCGDVITSRAFKAHIILHTRELYQTSPHQPAFLTVSPAGRTQKRLKTAPAECSSCTQTADVLESLKNMLKRLREITSPNRR